MPSFHTFTTTNYTSNPHTRSGAGSETTATELCGLTNHLLRNPHHLKRLTDEIRGAIKTDRKSVV